MRSDVFGHFRKLLNFFDDFFFRYFCPFLRKHTKIEVTSSFLDIFCSTQTPFELSTTLKAHLGMGYRPGMASASATGQLAQNSDTVVEF